MFKRLIITLALLGLGYTIYAQIEGKSGPLLSPGLTEKIQTTLSLATPQPTPFYEVTIPYLRERSYVSQLEDQKKVTSNASYTSYLTSYQSDGLKINGLLTKPQGDMPSGGWPAIVFVHGYIAPSIYRTTERYVAYVDYLAKQGFVVFKIDLRGHGDSEGDPSGAYYSSDYIIDVLNARSALQNSNFVNPQKVGLWGHSMAGNVTFRALATTKDIPAVAIWAGAVYTYQDFGEYGISDNSYRPAPTDSPSRQKRAEMLNLYGQFSPENPFWRQVAPTNYLEGVATAIQLHHAENDEVVPIEYSRNLVSVLDKTKIPHELYTYNSGGHNIDGASFNLAMHRTAEFFTKYLK